MTETPHHGHFAALDALRGIAAVLVVWFHSSFTHIARPLYVAPGNIYVDFFFILSGFVIAHAYLNRIGDSLSFGQFFWLRLARLWPLHLFMTLIFVLYGAGQDWLLAQGIGDGANPQNTGWALICNLLMIHALGLLPGLSWNYPSWSISVEFYTGLIFYLTALCCGRARLWPWLTGALIAYATLIGLALSAQRPTILASYDYGLIRCIGGVFAGVALARVVPNIRWPRHRNAAALQLAVLALVLVLLPFTTQSRLAQVLTIAAFLPLIGVLAMTQGPVTQVLSHPALIWLGKISYSIYLTHALLLSLTGFALRRLFDLPVSSGTHGRRVIETIWATPINLALIVIVIGVASLSYRWIERPAQRAMLSWSLPRKRPLRC